MRKVLVRVAMPQEEIVFALEKKRNQLCSHESAYLSLDGSSGFVLVIYMVTIVTGKTSQVFIVTAYVRFPFLFLFVSFCLACTFRSLFILVESGYP